MEIFIANISEFLSLLFGLSSEILGYITENPVLYYSVLCALVGSVILFAVGIIRKFGIRGIASSGRRRRIRR